MSEVVRLRTRAEIDEEAAAWIWRMDGAPPEEEREAYENWLRQDPRHRRAVEELTRTWAALDGLAQVQRTQAPLSPHDEVDKIALARPSKWWLAAAAALVAAVGGIAWLRGGNETQTLATTVGQHRSVALSDGTKVALNTNTILETSFSRHVREIYLRKGEAHFEVARDRSRPFLVHAGDALVRAVGTEFEVRLRSDRHVDVLVNEGRVEVRPDLSISRAGARTSSPAPGAVVGTTDPVPVIAVRAVSAGQQLSTATTSYAVTAVTPEQLSTELAWRNGAVVFDSAPLSEAIAEIQRYTDARILISDPSISSLPVGGRFKTDDLQGFLDGLEAALPITIQRLPDGTVYIVPRR
jgi:transmembrane sensor